MLEEKEAEVCSVITHQNNSARWRIFCMQEQIIFGYHKLAVVLLIWSRVEKHSQIKTCKSVDIVQRLVTTRRYQADILATACGRKVCYKLQVDCLTLLSTGLLQAGSTSWDESAHDKLQQV